MPFIATWMELEVIILREINQIEKDIYHMMFLIYGILMNLFTKQQQTHRLRK